MTTDNYWMRKSNRAFNRRRVIGGAAAGAVGLGAMGVVGCGDDSAKPASKLDFSAPTSTSGSGQSLVPPGMAERFPEIAANHWSKMTFSKNTPKAGGTIKTHIIQDAPNWDPGDPGINNWSSPFQVMYNRLVTADMSFESAFAGKDNFFKLFLKGDLAESFEQPDPLNYTFKLNKNVKFQNVPPMNGSVMTAEDVMYSFDYYKSPTAIGQSAILRDIDTISSQDPYTLTVKMKKPASYFLYSLAGPLVMIFNKKAHQAGADLKTTILGTGPYILDKHEYRNITRFKKNPDYFVPGRPYLEAIEMYWMPDDATKLSAYRTGQIDTLTAFGPYDVYYDQIMSTERGKTDVNVFQQNSGGQPNFAMNHRLPQYKDVRVRRGLSMALDRDAIVKARYSKGRWSMGLPTDWSARHFPLKGDEHGPYFQYNPKEAKAMLDQAGFAKDFEILVSSATGAPDDQAVLASEYWKQVGLNPTLKVVDSVAFSQRYNGAKDFGMVYSGPITGGTDLDDFGFRMLHTGQVANIQGISDPEVDRITEKVQETFERGPREKLGEELLQRELDQVFRIWGASPFLQDFKRPYIQGGFISHDVYFWANGWGMYTFADTWLDRA